MNGDLLNLVHQIPAKTPEELVRKLTLLATAGTLDEIEHKLGLDPGLVSLVQQIPAANPGERARKLELLAKAGTLSEVERKLGHLSAFDAHLLKLLRRIPAKSHHELEQKIASLIPEQERDQAVAEEKEGSWRGYNSFLVNLARRIPAIDPAELEAKIDSLIAEERQTDPADIHASRLSRRVVAAFRTQTGKERSATLGAAVARDTSGSFTLPLPPLSGLDQILTEFRRPFAAWRPIWNKRSVPMSRQMPSCKGVPAPTAAASTDVAPAQSPNETGDRSTNPAEAETFSSQAIPAEPFFTQPQHLALLGPRCELVSKSELAAAARRTIGGGIDTSFPRFINWLRSEGYGFAGFEDGAPRFDERLAYLRYDVHQADLLAAYVLADWHERLGITGSFQITWKFSRDQEEAEPYFLKLLEFDRRFVQFGLHAAPTATWYLYEKLGVDAAVDGIVDGSDFTEWVLDLHAAYCHDGDDAPALREIRAGTDDTLSRIAASFRSAFGEWKSISGHGNFLTKGFSRLRQQHPELEALLPYFYPEAYLAKWGLARFGFDHEITSFGSDDVPYPRVLFESNPEETRRRWYRGRVAHGAGFVALLHPATWTCRHNATFFLPGEKA